MQQANARHPLVHWRGEELTKRELIKRFDALYPTENAKVLADRIKKQTGHAVARTEISKLRRGVRTPPALPQSVPIPAPAVAAGPDVPQIVKIVKTLQEAIVILGGKAAVRQILDSL